MEVLLTLDDFIKKYDGRYIDYDGMYGNQCKDLFSLYNSEVVGVPFYVVGNAIDLWKNSPDEYYDKIKLNPRRGDVVIWGMGEFGHVAIYLDGDENNFTSLDQNYPVDSPVHKQNHNYKNVIGYLRPKGEDMTREQVENVINGFYLNYYHRQATNAEIKAHTDYIMADSVQKYAVSNWINKQTAEKEFKKWWIDPKTCNCIGPIGEAVKELEDEQIKEMQEHEAAIKLIDAKAKQLEKDLSACKTNLSIATDSKTMTRWDHLAAFLTGK
jgi:hypothetical protein